MSRLREQLIDEIPRLRRFARLMTRNRETADDLVQDVLVQALRAEPRWQTGNVHAWLVTILLNLNRNRLRSLARRPAPASLDQVGRGAAVVGSSGEGLDILRALDALRDDQREVLLLVAVEGLTYAECAAALSVPIGTIMSRLARARASIRALLEMSERSAPFPESLDRAGRGPPHPELRAVK